MAALLSLLVLWLAGGWFVIVRPATDRPSHVDAILVLGPPVANGRFALAYQLALAGYTDNLVLSDVPVNKTTKTTKLCADGMPAVKVTCFLPVPETTQGEARELQKLARANGWKRVMVITSTYHVSRARMIMKRCYDGTLLMVPASRGIGLFQWTYEYFYQTAAYVKAFVSPSC
ncbi:hypothetical protein BH10ACT8_BH10ACT8_19030 [soil metagenome]|jgi:hypothetical protein